MAFGFGGANKGWTAAAALFLALLVVPALALFVVPRFGKKPPAPQDRPGFSFKLGSNSAPEEANEPPSEKPAEETKPSLQGTVLDPDGAPIAHARRLPRSPGRARVLDDVARRRHVRAAARRRGLPRRPRSTTRSRARATITSTRIGRTSCASARPARSRASWSTSATRQSRTSRSPSSRSCPPTRTRPSRCRACPRASRRRRARSRSRSSRPGVTCCRLRPRGDRPRTARRSTS